MSRIGNLPVKIPSGVTVNVADDNTVNLKGPQGELSVSVDKGMMINVEENELVLTRPDDTKKYKSLHGLYRALISNAVTGVSEGYKKQLELVGVGYRADANGQKLELGIGFSHDVIIELPPEVKVEAKTERRSNPVVTLSSPDKQLIGHVAAKIRSLRPPEPYKGKGIKFVGEQLRRKAGKSASV
ncbi:MAG TPA: 50S ribosomal protein L6 [Bacteroidales bacterium]|nr:50S ribosomal protein L6 [Bacteroidales bacterium]